MINVKGKFSFVTEQVKRFKKMYKVKSFKRIDGEWLVRLEARK